ncbi:MAG: OmpA family protein [Segetibacter sp.]
MLLALGVIALIFFLMRGCNNDKGKEGATDSTSASTSSTGTTTDATGARGLAWGDVDFNAPAAAYEEITDKNIDIRGNNNYGIYGLGENILFDEGKNTIRKDAEQNLKQITTSIEKRYKGGEVRVFGYTDAIGSAGYNKELAEQRATAVRDWLVKNGSISEDRISIEPVGEARPVASNSTEQGRQQNRRVEIVAKPGKNNG